MILPENLSKFGFDKKPDKIHIESLTEIRQFIKLNFEMSDKINKTKTSLGLKIIVESNLDTYVTNGDFIAAMILEGYRYKRCGIIAYFNISKRTINNFLPIKKS